MGWMQTYTGRAYDPFRPRAEDIDVADIAHAMAIIPRYNGHTRIPYSIGHHSLLLLDYFRSQKYADATVVEALMHDAHEVYVQDIIRPVKSGLPDYRALERRNRSVLCERFGLFDHLPEVVHRADMAIMLDEQRALMLPPPKPWDGLPSEPLGVDVAAMAQMPWRSVEDRLLVEFARYGIT